MRKVDQFAGSDQEKAKYSMGLVVVVGSIRGVSSGEGSGRPAEEVTGRTPRWEDI